MAVNSVSSSEIDLTASYGVKSQREQRETPPAGHRVSPDKDGGDKDAQPQPTVNLHGQTVGTLINTKA
jgi:hypothetical protein